MKHALMSLTRRARDVACMVHGSPATLREGADAISMDGFLLLPTTTTMMTAWRTADMWQCRKYVMAL